VPDATPTRPPFDPEFVPFLEAMDARGRFRLETEMLPRMRQLEMTEAQLDEGLHARGLERRSITVPGHLGDPIALAVVQRIGRTGTAACAYDDWLLVHDVVLVSPDYRLAPEHPDPYPVEDCYAGLAWVAEHADELGVDPERIVLVGQSAGAGLAAGTALLARDRQGPAVVGQVLVSPMLDDRDATLSARQFDGVGVADREMTRFGWDAYLGDRRGGADVSIHAAPGRATDLAGLPPAYVDCGSAEVFRDEAVAYAGALWAACVQAELHVWPGAFHGSASMLPQATLSRRAVAALRDWTGRLLGSAA